METYPAALAEAVRNRRRKLGLSQQAVMDKSKRLDSRGKGVHTRTLSVIENGTRDNYHGSTLAILDRALDWSQGTCWSVFIGQSMPDVAVGPAEGDVLDRVERLEEILDALIAAVRRLGEVESVSSAHGFTV